MPLISIQNSECSFKFPNALDRSRVDVRSILLYKGDVAEKTIAIHIPTGKEVISYSSGQDVQQDIQDLEKMIEAVSLTAKESFADIAEYYSTAEEAMEAFDSFDSDSTPNSLVSFREHTINVSEIRYATRDENVILVYLKNAPQVSSSNS